MKKKVGVLPFVIIVVPVLILLASFAEVAMSQDKQDISGEVIHPIRPSATVIIVMLSIIFCLFFLVLAYVKLCHGRDPPNGSAGDQSWTNFRQDPRLSGVDRKIVESLPFFRFSSLSGSREGLECSVCLSQFDDSDILRLLPDCNHAFHVSCIDRWLSGHSSCPLCRKKLEAKELSRISTRNPSNLSVPEDLNTDNLELYIQREDGGYTAGSSFPLVEYSDTAADSMIEEGGEVSLHRFKHKIIVSDSAVVKSRWSDVNSSDLLLLSSEMIGESSRRGLEGCSGFGDKSAEKRSMSEITNLSRFALSGKMMTESYNKETTSTGEDERVKRFWGVDCTENRLLVGRPGKKLRRPSG
ncbi:hypothetical protein SAY87_009661 [Trapa incisa]|uniref:RING-type E3 ubiquitin transferase n=1 Tax=Trapa incisa TaxID=236973 RepID=A0AAN7JYS0_9MYRT|nr:hypothetical protein SAY87_009661 [Trapa incisa]